jgi:hypothetical protein
MRQHNSIYLLDTSIQVKRLISQKWRDARHDSIWDEITPATCMYSYMEFKNVVIGALRYLIDVLQEIKASKDNGDEVQARLSEVITYLNVDSSIRERDGRIKLASAYAAQIIKENKGYRRSRTIAEVIEQIMFEAENLETMWFFNYSSNGQLKYMQPINMVECDLGINKSPITEGRGGYTCNKGKIICNITKFISKDAIKRLIKAITNKTISIHNRRLREGVDELDGHFQSNSLKYGFSIGQKLCFPIGDCIIVSKAHEEGIGIITGDKDQVEMAKHLNIPRLYYNAHADVIE